MPTLESRAADNILLLYCDNTKLSPYLEEDSCRARVVVLSSDLSSVLLHLPDPWEAALACFLSDLRPDLTAEEVVSWTATRTGGELA